MLCPKCSSAELLKEFAVNHCPICGHIRQQKASIQNLWRQYRADQQRKSISIQNSAEGLIVGEIEGGNILLDEIEVPKWFYYYVNKG